MTRRDVIVIDPGHGGPDPGAVAASGATEARLALLIAHGVYSRLHLFSGAQPVLTHLGGAFSSVKNDDLAARVRVADRLEAAALVSVHCNAAQSLSAEGFEVWTSPGETPADGLATLIWRGLRDELPEAKGRADYDDGDPDKEARFYLLRHTRCPAVLVEVGFLSNAMEAARLSTTEYQSRAARGIAAGVLAWLEGGRS